MMESSNLKLAGIFYSLSLSDFDGRYSSFPSVSTFIDDISVRPAKVITTCSVVAVEDLMFRTSKFDILTQMFSLCLHCRSR